MSLYQEILQAWPEFRAIAGADVEVGGKTLPCLLVNDIADLLETAMETSAHVGTTRLAMRASDWTANGMGLEKDLHYDGRQWRVSGVTKNPLSPIVFFDVVAEGDLTPAL